MSKKSKIRRTALHSRFGFGRYGNLMFAYLRGMPYRRVELTTRQNNKPDAMRLLTFQVPGAPDGGAAKDMSRSEIEAALEPFRKWLDVPATEEMLERARLAREECLTAKAARAKVARALRKVV